MGVMYGFLILIEIVVSALLIVVIFMQKAKGGMGGSAFGGGGAGEAIFGSRMGNVLTKATVVLGVIFLVNTLLLTVMTSRRGPGGSVMEGASARRATQSQPGAEADAGAAGWMETEMQSDGDLPGAMDVPFVMDGPDAGEGVLVIPPAETPDAVEVDTAPEFPDEDVPTASDA